MSSLALAIRFARRELRSGLSGFRKFLTDYGAVSESATLRSMANSAKDPMKRTLVELKAVDAAYPLLGQAVLAPAADLQSALACGAPGCGAVVEDALLVRLGIKTGDSIRIGDSDFVVRARIVTEPDRVAGGFTLGPRVLISSEGLSRAKLITPGSLLNYSYRVAFASETTTPEQFRASLAAAFPDAVWEINDRSNAIPRVTRFVEQATMFLTLVGLTALVVAGVGAGQAAEAFLQIRPATIATLEALGAEGNDIFLIYLIHILAGCARGV